MGSARRIRMASMEEMRLQVFGSKASRQSQVQISVHVNFDKAKMC